VDSIDFRAIVEQLPLVVYVDALDDRSSAVYVSPQIQRLLGYTQEEWLADPELFVKSLHPDDRDWVLREIDARNRGRKPESTADYRLVARDGSVVWVRDDEVVVRGPDGRPLHVEGYLQDVTASHDDRTRLELLAGVLALAAEEMSPEELIAEATERLAAALGDIVATFVEIHPGPKLRPRYTTSPAGLPEALPVIPKAFGPLLDGPLVIDDVFDEAWLEAAWPVLEARGVRAAVDVPLRRNGEICAVIWFNSSEPRRWTDDEVQTLWEVATQLGLMLERAEAREQRERAAEELRQRDAILEAITRSAQTLLVEPGWRDAAPAILRELGEATAASRAYIFENGVDERGRPVTSQRFEWVAEGVTSELDNPVMQDMCWEEAGMARMRDVVSRDEVYTGVVRELEASERELLEAQDIRSIMTVPIFVDGAWWGVIGFDDCVRERTWSARETDALRLAASLIASAIGRERGEALLREHEHKLRAVFESALDAIFITNDRREIVDANPAASEMLGVSKRDLLTRRLDDFLPPEELATLAATWKSFLADGTVAFEQQFRRADGMLRQADVIATPQFLPGLNISFARDVTERKRLEAELLSAQRLDSLGRLAGGVAHDFNNLLTAISGYAALARERANGDETLAHDVDEIQRAAGRAAELTRQLLAFGRRQVLQPRAIDLSVVVAEIGDLLARLIGEDVELAVEHEPGAHVVHADPGQIEQVIVNLAVNARDAMPDGGRLTISIGGDPSGESVLLRVADTGAGMDEETQERVFEPFFTTREDGVGLGLASVYGIVRQSFGEVSVASAPGEGATFVVRLPRVHADQLRMPEADAEEAVEPGSETILLVEDEDVVRTLARRVLERAGYTVLACADGAEALAVAERHEEPIHLLLTDVVMPGLRGHEVARRVAASRPEIKVLYMSGYADEALLAPSAIDHEALIEKPFAVENLTRRVREALETTAAVAR
jgi:PAS domain S-box-containing protein